MTAYSFMDVNATLVGAGAIIDLGYGSASAEEGVDITMAEAKNKMTIGADGEGMHSLHAGKSGQITIRLLQTSPQNAKLMALYDAQSMSAALWGANIITISNSASGDQTVGRECAFTKRPDLKYAKDGGIISWVFDAIKIDGFLGTY
ncbi:phage structural protein [Microvirgula aerodenitrificans]|uniref:phage structural protein n=1 Tax=Microvirgula aerodenitrificans TaxID=57480 RepID=UPI0028F12E81|nr:phage protein [Microvirgula aerodenitrificans]